jgi:hypothetical protein
LLSWLCTTKDNGGLSLGDATLCGDIIGLTTSETCLRQPEGSSPMTVSRWEMLPLVVISSAVAYPERAFTGERALFR